MTSFSVQFDHKVRSVHFFILSDIWSAVSSHADHSYQNSIIFFSGKKTGIYGICFVTEA